MVINSPVHFRLDNSDPHERLKAGLRHFVGEQAVWLPAYDRVAAWLGDNEGRGLLCVGTCGLGKSVVCTQVLPVLLHWHFGLQAKVVTATGMNQHIDDLLKYCRQNQVIIIDDLGKEPVRVYGRSPFFELCDAAERTGTLLVISTNLSTTPTSDRRYASSIQARYGDAVISRLRSITKVVVFEGEDMRR